MDKEELIRKYNIDLEKLKKEQIDLAKDLEIKDKIDFSLASRFGAIENLIIKNKIISAMVVVDKDYEVIEEAYFVDVLRFPYIFEFRSYREIPAMVGVFSKIREKPDLIFIKGHGITHPRLGIASHLSLSINTPVIGIGDSLFEEDKIKGEDILIGDKVVGRVLKSKQGSKPMYISSGDKISLETAYNFSKEMINEPHKMPEPLHIARRYAKDIKKELKL